MRLNTKYSIALHCLVFLAEYGDQMKVTSEVLARSTGCNPVIIRNILGALQRENFVTIARGVGGVSADRGSHTADHGEHHSPTASGLLP